MKIEVIQAGADTTRRAEFFGPLTHETTRTTGIHHRGGTVSMARAAPGTARDQFFICVTDQPELDFGGKRNPDGQGFAAFGQVIDGIEFRSLTVRAFKGKEGACLERNQAVVYRGPWRSVADDDGHTFARGQRIAVCDKTYRILTDPRGPYAESVLPVPPEVEIPIEAAAPFACQGSTRRDPRVTKGNRYESGELEDGAACSSSDCCA